MLGIKGFTGGTIGDMCGGCGVGLTNGGPTRSPNNDWLFCGCRPVIKGCCGMAGIGGMGGFAGGNCGF